MPNGLIEDAGGNMAAKTLSLFQKLTKSASKPDLREDVMAGTQNGESKKDKAARAAGREKRKERKAEKAAKRDAAHKEKSESGKPSRLCSLATVEVKKGSDGFHVSVSGSQGSKTFTIAPDRTSQVLRDLETAIVVIRGQL